MQVQPYLHFDGCAEEALKFYEAKLGAQIQMLLRFSDAPPNAMPMGDTPPNKVMHAGFKLGDALVLASDGMCGGKAEFKGVTLTMIVNTEAEAERLFAAVTSEGGKAQMPMSETFFAGRFGMAVDKFGVNWMVLGNQKKN